MCPAVHNMVPWPPQCSVSVCPCPWQKCCSNQRTLLYFGFSFGCFSADSGHKQHGLVEKQIDMAIEDYEAVGFFVILHQTAENQISLHYQPTSCFQWSWRRRAPGFRQNLAPRLCLHLCSCSVIQPTGKTPHLVSSLYILQMSSLMTSPSIPAFD